jgi:hypothetical protein
MLRELLLRERPDAAGAIENDRAGTGSALVQGEHE